MSVCACACARVCACVCCRVPHLHLQPRRFSPNSGVTDSSAYTVPLHTRLPDISKVVCPPELHPWESPAPC